MPSTVITAIFSLGLLSLGACSDATSYEINEQSDEGSALDAEGIKDQTTGKTARAQGGEGKLGGASTGVMTTGGSTSGIDGGDDTTEGDTTGGETTGGETAAAGDIVQGKTFAQPTVNIVSTPINQAVVGSQYIYIVEVVSTPAEATLKAALVAAPAAMTIAPVENEVGRFKVTWLPSLTDVGAHSVQLTVMATSGTQTATSTQNFSLAVEDNCQAGQVLAIWHAVRDASSGYVSKGDYLGYVQPYTDATGGNLSAEGNYNYYSDSAHPVNGPTPTGFESQVFLYSNNSGNYFNFYHNIDQGGSTDNTVNWDIYTANNSNQDGVVLSDDKLELKNVASNELGKKYEARMRYWSNTDGGVIGPFVGTEWAIYVQTSTNGDNLDAAFYSYVDPSQSTGAEQRVSLAEAQQIKSFLITYQETRVCN